LGSLPLSLSTTLSPIRFHQLSIFSVGLLIGAALTIVIPEGIDTIYSSSSSSSSTSPATGSNSSLSAPNLTGPSVDQPIPNSHHHHSTIGLALMGGFMLMYDLHTLLVAQTHISLFLTDSYIPLFFFGTLTGQVLNRPTDTSAELWGAEERAQASTGP
jgi:hypothetical protein